MPYYIKSKPKASKSSSALVRKLDKTFSLYIRLRDSAPWGHRFFRCISCGQVKPFDQMDCGHFISRTHMATRFDTQNAHGECRYCNRFSADHLLAYQRNLEAKIGKQAVEMLMVRGRQTKKWSAFELELLIKHFEDEIKKMDDEEKTSRLAIR